MRVLSLALVCCSSLIAPSLATAASCPPLSERLTKYSVPIDGKVNLGNLNVMTGEETWYNRNSTFKVETASAPNGSFVIGWKGTDNKLHYTRLNSQFEKVGSDLTSTDNVLHNIEAYDDGFIAFTFSNDRSFYLTRYDADGTQKFRTRLYINAGSSTMHTGRATYWPEKKGFVVYYGNHNGGHEGDARQFIDNSGVVTRWDGSWSWGCSHSTDIRQMVTNGKLYSICLADVYPQAGINLNHGTHIMTDVYHYNGFGTGELAGMATIKGHMVIGYASTYQSSGGGRDFGLTAFDLTSNSPLPRTWITRTNTLSENRVKIGRLGQRLLALWSEQGSKSSMRAMEFDIEFAKTMTLKPVVNDDSLAVAIDNNADVSTMPNGDAIFASAWGEMNQLEIQRIAACE